jgi:hypothetical protein
MTGRLERQEDWQMRLQRFAPLVLVAALTLGVSGLLAGCGSGDSGSVETSVSDGNVTTYTDSAYGFSFDYPADWRVAASEGAAISSGADPTKIITVGDPNGATVGDTGLDVLMIRVYELGAAVDEASLPQVLPALEQLVADFQTQDPTFKVEGPLAQTVVGGMPGYRATGTFAWDANTPVKTTFYFLFAGNIEYQVTVQASGKTWDADQEVFAAFLASFKPGASTN